MPLRLTCEKFALPIGIVVFLLAFGLSVAVVWNLAKTQATTADSIVPATEVPKDAISIAPQTIWELYSANGLQTDQKYKGKTVQWDDILVRGMLLSNGGDYSLGLAVVSPAAISQNRYLQLSPIEKKWYDEGCPPNVVCKISPDGAAEFAKISFGQKFTASARCQGMKKDANVWRGYVVNFVECRLISVSPKGVGAKR